MVWPALCLRHQNKTQHITLVFQKSFEHTSNTVRKEEWGGKEITLWTECFVSSMLIGPLLKFWLLFENNYSLSSLKHSLPRPPHTDWNGDWWQQQAATSLRLVFHWSNCINQGCLQRVHIVQWWMTAGNYATAQKHHTSHLWCADTAVESNAGLTQSTKKKKKKVWRTSWSSAWYVFKRWNWKKKMGQEWTEVRKILMGLEVKKREEAQCLWSWLCPALLISKTKWESTSGRIRINCILIISGSAINELAAPACLSTMSTPPL